MPAAAGGFAGAHVLPHLALPHPAAAAMAAAARNGVGILPRPATLGVPARAAAGEDSNGGFAGGAGGGGGGGGSTSSSSQWCSGPGGCRRGLSSRGPCFHCGTTYSSQWRSGPPHKPVLCNACGLYYRKVQSLPDHTCQVAGALEVRGLVGGLADAVSRCAEWCGEAAFVCIMQRVLVTFAEKLSHRDSSCIETAATACQQGTLRPCPA